MDQKRWNPFVALAILACFLTFEASAQFGGAFGGTRPGRGGAARGGETQGAPRESRNERPVVAPDVNSPEQIDYRLSLLQEDLKLVGEQNAVWHRFAGNAHAYVGDIARERSRGGGSPAVSAPPVGLQHIAAAVDGARNRLAALEEVESAAKALYLTLNPTQRMLADMRIPAIIAPRPVLNSASGPAGNLPDLGGN